MQSRVATGVRAVALGLALTMTVAACGDDKSKDETAVDELEDALAEHAEGRFDEAVEGYGRVLEDQPENQYALYNLGLIDQQAGRLAEAETRYRAAVQADPNFAPALFNLAILRTDADPAEAEQLYRSVLVVRPDDASAHLNLGFLLIAQGEEEEGQDELDQAVELDPALASRLPEAEPEDAAEEPADPILESTTTSTAP